MRGLKPTPLKKRRLQLRKAAQMTDTATITDQENFVAQFERLARVSSAGPGWLSAQRRSAINKFAAIGYPTRNDEEWRFTNPAQIAETPFTITDAKSDAQWLADCGGQFRDLVAKYLMGRSNHLGIAFINGRCVTT